MYVVVLCQLPAQGKLQAPACTRTLLELHLGCWADHVRMYVTIYNVVHVFVQVEAAKRFVFHLIQAAGHQTVYAVIDHTKKGPIPASPVEQLMCSTQVCEVQDSRS